MKVYSIIVTGLYKDDCELPDPLGVGRDEEEARCHAGYDSIPKPNEFFWNATLTDEKSDFFSEHICELVCDYYLNEDSDISIKIKHILEYLVESKQYASAIWFCMCNIWDGEEEELG